jgi:hypothetical protein
MSKTIKFDTAEQLNGYLRNIVNFEWGCYGTKLAMVQRLIELHNKALRK